MAHDLKYGEITVEHDSDTNPINGSDEPVFLLRSQDKVACDTIEFYIARSAEVGSEPDFIEKTGQVYDAFADWRTEHPDRVKIPD